MKRVFFYFNVGSSCAAILFLGFFPVNALLSGYPWTITCYNCNICRLACPAGIDPYGFVTAALINDPDHYVSTTRLRLTLAQAGALDPDMSISLNRAKMKAQEARSRGIADDTEVTVVAMKAKHAAKYCFLCANCSKQCPISLPIKDIAQELSEKGGFR
jgi:Fe-S oxidoreductase